MPRVYEDELERDKNAHDAPLTEGSHDRLSDQTPEERDKFSDIAGNYGKSAPTGQEDQNAAAARDKDVSLKDREKDAGNETGAGSGGGKSDSLAKQESDSKLFNPEKDSKGGKGGLKNLFKTLKKRKKATLVGLLVSLVAGGGGGLGVITVITGPLEFIHAGRLFSQFHFEPKNGQASHRMSALARNIHYLREGRLERSRLSERANKKADAMEKRFNNSGIESAYTGRFRFQPGYMIDPAKLAGNTTGHLKGKTPQEIKDYFQQKYGIELQEAAGGFLFADVRKLGYRAIRILTLDMVRASGVDGIPAWTAARRMIIRGGLDAHPIRKLDRKILQSAEQRFDEWRKRQQDKIANGTRPPTTGTGTRPGEDGNPNENADGQKNQTDEILQESQKAGEDIRAGKPGALTQFQNSLYAKFTGSALNVVGIVCFALYIMERIDEINHQNVVMPMMRMGGDAISTGSQIEYGKKDVDQEQLGFLKKLYYSRKNKSSWSDARSINAELGKPLSGPDLPDSARINHDGNPISRIITAVPGIQATCAFADSTFGQIVLTGVALGLTGPLSVALGVGLGFALGPFVEMIAKIFSASVVDAMAEGAERGNFMNYGARFAARDMALGWGALPVTRAQGLRVGQAEKELRLIKFQSESLAYRLFNPEDPQTFFAQVIQRQTPDPMTNIARASNGLLNIGNSFASMATAPLSAAVRAEPLVEYDYGFPDYVFTVEEMDDLRVENPYDNEEKAIAAIEGPNGQTYIDRAKKCFGVGIAKGGPKNLWDVLPPQFGEVPMQKAVTDPANQCSSDKGEEWFRVRFWIFDIQIMAGFACYEGDEDSCVAVGMTPPAGGAVPGGATGSPIAGATCTDVKSCAQSLIDSNGGQGGGLAGPAEQDLRAAVAGTPIAACGAGQLNLSLLQMLVKLGSAYKFHIFRLTTGHDCNGGQHPTGRAADLDLVNGVKASATSLRGEPYQGFGKAIMGMLPNGGGLGQRQCLGDVGLTAGKRYFDDQCHHIHIDAGATAP